MTKRRIAAFGLSLLLLFSGGCSLVDIDEEKAAEIENNKTIVEYNGQLITKGEVTLEMTRNAASMGTTIDALKSNEETWAGYRDYFVKKVAIDRIALDKAKELGLDTLTEEETKTITDTYDSVMSTLDSFIAPSVQAAVDADSSLNYDEEYKRQLKLYLNSIGYDPDTYRETLENELIVGKVRDHFLKDISVTDEEVQTYYDTQVSIQQNNLEISPDSFAWQQSLGSTIMYYPDGYKKVRHILVQFDEETRSKALEAYSEEDKTEYNKILEAAVATIQPTIDEIVAKMEAGDDFATLIDEYNKDSSMSIEPTRTEGKVVGPQSTDITTPGYLDAVAALADPGSYKVLNTYSGCYIIRCDKLMAGAVPFDDLKDSIKNTLLSTAQENEWGTVSDGWIEDAKSTGKLKLYPDRF